MKSNLNLIVIAAVFVGLVMVAFSRPQPFSTDALTTGNEMPTLTPVPTSESQPWWQPGPGISWQIQFTGELDTSYPADMYDIDLFDHDKHVVESLHHKGIITVAYINAGAWEDWRPDADQFPEKVLGNSNGWAGERWLDIRQLDVIGPILEKRLDLALQKGFDGIDFDNMDGYTNDTGFPLTYDDQLYFNTWLATAAHQRGLSVGLKNDIEQVEDLAPWFDWAINEQCFQYEECDYPDGGYLHFIEAGKPVFQIEYDLAPSDYCAQAIEWGFSAIQKKMALDAWIEPCQ